MSDNNDQPPAIGRNVRRAIAKRAQEDSARWTPDKEYRGDRTDIAIVVLAFIAWLVFMAWIVFRTLSGATTEIPVRQDAVEVEP